MSIQYPIDLHVHSTCSDGLETPAELCEHAQKLGIHTLALSDHDTLSGVALMRDAIRELAQRQPHRPPIRFLPSIELSTGDGGRAHLLGFGVDPENAALQQCLEQIRQERAQRGRKMLERLRKQGITFPREMEEQLSAPGTGRAHMARALCQIGVVHTMQHAFDRYLNRGCCAYVHRSYLPISEGVRLLTQAGGTVVLAHPCRLGLEFPALAALVKELKDAGLSGLEAFHPSASRKQAPELASLARSLSLLITGGSDYHGDPDTSVRLGRMPSGWNTLQSDLEALLAAMEAANPGSTAQP